MSVQKTGRNGQMYLEMRKAAVDRLKDRSMEEMARKAGAELLPGGIGLAVDSMGKRYELELPGFICREEADGWFDLVTLHYLDLADGTPASREPACFGEMKDGLIRGTGFDRDAERRLGQLLRGKEPGEIRAACERLGAVLLEDRSADLCAVLPFLPRLPMILKVWYADEEFDSAGKLFLTASADHYLAIEDAVTAGELVLRQLQEELDRKIIDKQSGL